MSKIRKQYFVRLIVRIMIFIICLIMCFKPEFYDILNGMNFFASIHILHLLWMIWIFDMILQIIPIKNKVALGSQKLFANRFQPIHEKINNEALNKYIKNTTSSAYKVLIIWVLLIAIIGLLYKFGIMNKILLFMISVCLLIVGYC